MMEYLQREREESKNVVYFCISKSICCTQLTSSSYYCTSQANVFKEPFLNIHISVIFHPLILVEIYIYYHFNIISIDQLGFLFSVVRSITLRVGSNEYIPSSHAVSFSGRTTMLASHTNVCQHLDVAEAFMSSWFTDHRPLARTLARRRDIPLTTVMHTLVQYMIL